MIGAWPDVIAMCNIAADELMQPNSESSQALCSPNRLDATTSIHIIETSSEHR
jgi:hypothetical protein